jgi:hypothetical protein
MIINSFYLDEVQESPRQHDAGHLQQSSSDFLIPSVPPSKKIPKDTGEVVSLEGMDIEAGGDN